LKKETKEKIINYGLTALQLGAIIYFFENYSLGKGFLFSMLFFLFIVGIRAIRQRGQIRQIVHYIETILFGKPLNKEYWGKDEKPEMRKVEKNDRRKHRKAV